MKLKSKYLYAEANYGIEEINSVLDVLKNQRHYLMGGTKGNILESKVSKIFGMKYGLMTNSGSSALMLAFEILNLPEGSEVITPALTFGTTASYIVRNKLIPVFVDVKEGTYCIDENKVEKAITKKTKAIVAPHLLGNIVNWKKIYPILKKTKLKLLKILQIHWALLT